MKTLIFCPLNPYPITPSLHPQTRNSIEALRGDDVDVLYYLGDNESPDKLQNVMECYRAGRKAVLDGGYDAMLTVEADMIVPPDTLEKLATIDTDVAYGLYVLRQPHYHRWSTFLTVEGNHGVSVSEFDSAVREMWGRVVNVAGVGMGCTLIRRHVLEEIDFRLDTRRGFRGRGNDWYFSVDCQWREYRQMADLSVVCGHIAEDIIYWPDPMTRKRYRVELNPYG